MASIREHGGVVSLRPLLTLLLGFAFLCAVYVRFYSGMIPVMEMPHWPSYLAYFALSVAAWVALEGKASAVDLISADTTLAAWAASLAKLNGLTVAVVSLAVFFWRDYSFSRFTVIAFWCLHLVLSGLVAWLLRVFLRRQHRDDAYWIEIDSGDAGSIPRTLDLLETSRLPPSCREVLVALPVGEVRHLGLLTEALNRLPVPGAVILPAPPHTGVRCDRGRVVFCTGPRTDLSLDYALLKRAFDFLASALGLMVLSPLFVLIALVTFFRSGRPVLIRQERVGRSERRFFLLKFRTLPAEALKTSGWQWTAPPADAWGAFLRETGLDELPQLFNVLRGEMSLVGPRPERPYFVERFRRDLPFYSARHRFRVGITGWAQVNGLRGDTSIRARVEHDLYYLNHWSLALDLQILWMTLVRCCRALRPRFPGGGKKTDVRLV